MVQFQQKFSSLRTRAADGVVLAPKSTGLRPGRASVSLQVLRQVKNKTKHSNQFKGNGAEEISFYSQKSETFHSIWPSADQIRPTHLICFTQLTNLVVNLIKSILMDTPRIMFELTNLWSSQVGTKLTITPRFVIVFKYLQHIHKSGIICTHLLITLK